MSQKYNDTRKELLENLRARIDMGGLSRKDWQDIADAAKLLGDFEDSEALYYYSMSQAGEEPKPQVNTQPKPQVNTQPEKKQSFSEEKTVPLTAPNNKNSEPKNKIPEHSGRDTTVKPIDPPKNKKSKKPLLIAAIVVIIALCGGAFYYMSMIKPVNDVKALMEEHKYDEAYDKAKEFLSKHEDSDKLNLTKICEEQLQYELDQKNFSQAYDIMKAMVGDSKIAGDNEYVATVDKEYLNSEKEANGNGKAYELLLTMLSETSITNEDDFVVEFCKEYVNAKKDESGYVDGHKLLKKMIADGAVKEDASLKNDYQSEMIAYAKSESKNKEAMKTAWDTAIYLTEQKIIEKEGSEMQEIFNNEFQTAIQALSNGKNDNATAFIKSAAKKEYFKKFEVNKEDALKLSYSLLDNGQDAGKLIPDGILIDLKMGKKAVHVYQEISEYYAGNKTMGQMTKDVSMEKCIPIKIVEKKAKEDGTGAIWEYTDTGKTGDSENANPYDETKTGLLECKKQDSHYKVYLMPGNIDQIPEGNRAKSFKEATCYAAKQMIYFTDGNIITYNLYSDNETYTPYFYAGLGCVIYSAGDDQKYAVMIIDGTHPKPYDEDWFENNKDNNAVIFSDDALLAKPDYDMLDEIYDQYLDDYQKCKDIIKSWN